MDYRIIFCLMELLYAREWKDCAAMQFEPADGKLMRKYHRVLIEHVGIIIQNACRCAAA